MGIRQSKLDEVPSLALGTSPVTLKEMVTSFATIVNGGNYIEPYIVTAVEDRQKQVLDTFMPRASEQAMANQASMTLLDVMRDVVDSGTAAGLRPRFGLNGLDLAGKTGTTQDNTDGWFVLMHPQLVAGAWMGFNDNRVTMRSEYWGQGAHNALFVVGDFMQQSVRAGVVDSKAAFAAPRMQEQQPLLERMGDWWNSVFSTPTPPDPGVAAVPETQLPDVNLRPPVLEPPPATVGAENSMPAPLPGPAVAPNAPVIVEPQRVPAYPRPLESARPMETVPGTQVYRVPDTTAAGAARDPAPAVVAPSPTPPPRDTVLVPRPITIAPREGASAVVRDITVTPREVTSPAGSTSASGSPGGSAGNVPAASGDAGGSSSVPAQ
jgi:penicillin-binding protein 1A